MPKKEIKYFLILLSISIFAFWKIALLQYTLKWDFIAITIPWRYFIGESLQNGILPLWSPYAKLGFPLYFDAQTWYPISHLISITFGYNIYTIHLEFVFHVFMAGFGMFILTKHFIQDLNYRFISAVIFMLSGFFVGNAQHMGWIVSAAWIPFIFNSYLNIFKNTKSYKPVFATVLFTSLLFTGGYFPFFLTTIYVLVFIFLFKIIKTRKDKNLLKTLITKHLILFILFFLVNIVTIFSLFEAYQNIPRGNGISLERAIGESIEPRGLLSFIFPYAISYGTHDFWGGEKSVMISYFGIISFFIICFSLFIKKDKTQKLLIFLGFFAFMTAMGHIFPFRKIFYYVLPFFNMFRFPSLFRFFGILAFSIVVGAILLKISKDLKLQKKFNKYILISLAIFIILMIFFFIKYKTENSIPKIDLLNKDLIRKILFQGAFHIFTITIFLIALIFVKNQKIKNLLIIFSFVIDMTASIQLNSNDFINSDYKQKDLQKEINKLPKGFPVPNNNEKIVTINDKSPNIGILWRNKNYFHKKTAYDGVGPYQLNNFTNFENSGFFKELLNNNLLFFATNIILSHDNLDTSFVKNNSNGLVITTSKNLLNNNLENKSTNYIEITDYNPQLIKAKVNISQNSLLVFMQNYYPYWQAFVDNKKVDIIEVNYSQQSIIVPKGEHEIVFKFVNNKIIISFWISTFSFLILVLSLVYISIKQKNNIKIHEHEV
ncbi:MAG: YfhO family protein [Bacteroidales bacterium]|nr:YfhO family protein [Bacteroidales bacterium]